MAFGRRAGQRGPRPRTKVVTDREAPDLRARLDRLESEVAEMYRVLQRHLDAHILRPNPGKERP
jgi:hypothetical protein